MSKHFRPALAILLVSTLLFGVIYPALVTGIGYIGFPYNSGGSIIENSGRKLGSELISQNFSDPKYLWPRPSATAPVAYNAAASMGSNLSAANPVLTDQVKARIRILKDSGVKSAVIPGDLVTASGSGLDPHISLEAAELQIPRLAKVRKMTEDDVRAVIAKYTEGRQFGIFGEIRVNVLKVNLELDNL
jgi:potassium-transporting ATPase KdpC subunit